MLKYLYSITIAAGLLDDYINACPSPLIDHYTSFIPSNPSYSIIIYEPRHIVLIYLPCCTRLPEVQIPSLPMDIGEIIAIMGAKNLPYSSTHNTPLFPCSPVLLFPWQFNYIPTLKNPATCTYKISLHYFIS